MMLAVSGPDEPILRFEDLLHHVRLDDADAVGRLAETALDEQREDKVLQIADAAARKHKSDARLWQWSALLHRGLDDRRSALQAFRRATALAPSDASIAHGEARTAFEAGLPAVSLYQKALKLAPQQADIALGLAAAKVAGGNLPAAVADLERLLSHNPGWLAGHRDLAQLRWTHGQREIFVASYVAALHAMPTNPSLWHQLIVTLLQAGRYEDALKASRRARDLLGAQPLLAVHEATAYSETGDIAAADAAFNEATGILDPGVATARIRHALRAGRLEPALTEIDAWIGKSHAPSIWPYAATTWRLAGDPRHDWLDLQEGLVRVVDLADKLPPLERLQPLLNSLHGSTGEQFGQSVRTGTQTSAMLFARIDDDIEAVRRAVTEAVDSYIASLPKPDPAHPTLMQRRDRRTRFAGSWSVRLRNGGHHSNHAHPEGWISSALYIALPKAASTPTQQGWLTFGQPPVELGIDLDPTRVVEPRAGRLVLFPSIMWHGTRPFLEGERLTCAFDIQMPLEVP